MNSLDPKQIGEILDQLGGGSNQALSLGPFYFSLLLFFAIPVIGLLASRSASDNIQGLVRQWFTSSLVIGGLCIALSLTWWFYAQYTKVAELNNTLVALKDKMKESEKKVYVTLFQLVASGTSQKISKFRPINMMQGRPILAFLPNNSESSWIVLVVSDQPISQGVAIPFQVFLDDNRPLDNPTWVPFQLPHTENAAIRVKVGLSGALEQDN